MPAQALFTPSGTPTSMAVQPTGSQIPMPTPDGANTDLAITSTGLVYLSFGPNLPVGDTVAGCLKIPAGSQVLLTANANVIALLAANPLVLSGPQATSAATATVCSARAGDVGAIVTLQRGTAGANNRWSA